jgi:FHA domain
MATVNYRCEVDPACRTESDRPEFCPVHHEPLSRVPAPATAPATVAAQPPAVALSFCGELLPVPPEGLELGRDSPGCVSVPGLAGLLQVGRRHARIFWHEGVLTVVDLRSTNGTFVDGRRLAGTPAPLPAGSTLRLGLDVEIPVLELDEFGLPKG